MSQQLDTVQIKLGDTPLQIITNGTVQEANRMIFLNVHEDEHTSIEALEIFNQTTPIHYFYLNHLQTRRVEFLYRNKIHSVDPNRIFTRRGRRKTLKDGGKKAWGANGVTKLLAQEILLRIPLNHTVIAVHNNTDVNYSIKSYLPGGDEAQNTADIYINPDMDPDDFVYTTELYFFEALKNEKVNVILQDNQRFVNDGSLSVYCGKNQIPYLNIETQKGHLNEQLALMEVVHKIVKNRSLK